MDCLDHSRQKAFTERFGAQIFRDRIPLSGSIDLTTACNFNCVHCYIPERSRKTSKIIPNTGFILNLLDEIVEQGCLYVLFTGGEPLLHPDFDVIYTHAKKKGMITTVFTNGSTVRDEHIRLFRDLPPFIVEVSIYGGTPETYEAVTGIQGSFDKTMNGIQKLHQNGIRFCLKTVLMDLNRHELHAMEAMATQLGVTFRFDTGILPRIDGDKTPLSRRIAPEDAVELEFREPDRIRKWKHFLEHTDIKGPNDTLYMCGAGRASFHVTAHGELRPCLMAPGPSWDLTKGSFSEGWHSHIVTIGRFRTRNDNPCRECGKIAFCEYCPPFFQLETGSPDVCSDFLCRLGHLRHDRIYQSDINRRSYDH